MQAPSITMMHLATEWGYGLRPDSCLAKPIHSPDLKSAFTSAKAPQPDSL